MPFVRLIFLFILLLANTSLSAKINAAKYGIPVDATTVKVQAAQAYDSLLKAHPQVANKNVLIGIERSHIMADKTMDFYVLLFLCLMLGFMKYFNPHYFNNLWKAFRNPTLSSRQIKEQIEIAFVANLLMNIFFTLVIGLYVYYLVRLLVPAQTGNIQPGLLMLMLVGGIGVIYLGKYAVIRFSGWAFNVEGITENYIYNIFLINKMTAIMLLPFVAIMAFANASLAGPAIIISAIVILVMFINRYTRSWQVFGSFFQYSKFHFFTYLCASELLPLAVLMKLLVRGLLY